MTVESSSSIVVVVVIIIMIIIVVVTIIIIIIIIATITATKFIITNSMYEDSDRYSMRTQTAIVQGLRPL